MATSDSPLFVKSVEKAFSVLRAFTRESQSLTQVEIAARADLDKSSAQRFVHTLHALGYLVKDASGRAYSLSPRLLEFGFSYLDMDPVIASTQQQLKELHDQTGETINLAKLDGTDIILVARWPSKRIISVSIRVGARLPAIYMASGRVMISQLSRDERQAYIDRSEITRHTEHSLIDRAALELELDRVRAQGYCVTRSQYFHGDLSIAAPIIDAKGAIVASASVNTVELNGPDKEREQVLIDSMLAAARACSDNLRHMG
ncbi:IclR family transcriptional regulator [Bosea sp. (in: a-proteobacteria)]|uniref:IclR family transcriptional regulator n=1 Tax=Bosea sp. (in: a-proteobacteria) TaxID=1871050 RepID=UPI002DDD6FEA|nr:IclR family transcriptional regulator C-terminal domain-containing protein [Bosea sp. (in: a-proteobacteria)]HEV2510773.1 IclR family transcriptional regulator C-terminal domain-containing protein [Bosea sp. (in: a-proteobacteria)]